MFKEWTHLPDAWLKTTMTGELFLSLLEVQELPEVLGKLGLGHLCQNSSVMHESEA